MTDEKQRVVFLDVDGVLNSRRRWDALPLAGKANNTRVDPLAVARLKRILDATGADIVVSSTWRLCYMTELVGFLAAHGIPRERVVGQTPHNGDFRGAQISAWLLQHGGIEHFVILDDSSDMGRMMPWLVQTSWDDGLEDEHVERAITLLRDGL